MENIVQSQLHLQCTNYFKSQIAAEPLTSLFCGKLLLNPSTKQNLQFLGLVHFFVISGFHISLYQHILLKIFKSKKLSFLLLSFVLAVCNFQPASYRAYIFVVLFEINKIYKLFWPKVLSHFFAIFICLCLHPEWYKSLGFHLSWIASLIVYTKYSNHNFTDFLFRCTFLYLLLGHILQSFTGLHYWQFPIGVLFSYIFSYYFFPLSFMAIFNSQIAKFVMYNLYLLNQLVHYLSLYCYQLEQAQYSVNYQFFYSTSLSFIFWFTLCLKKRYFS